MANIIGFRDAIWNILYYKYDWTASNGTGVLISTNRILTCQHGIVPQVMEIRARMVVGSDLEYVVKVEYARPDLDLAILKFSDPHVRFDSTLRLSRKQVLSVGDVLIVIGNERNVLGQMVLGKITFINVGVPCQAINPSTFNNKRNFVHNPTREYHTMSDIPGASKTYHPNLPIIRYEPAGIYYGRSGGPLLELTGGIAGIHTHGSSTGLQVAVHLSAVRFFWLEASKRRQKKSRLLYLRFRGICARVKREKINYKRLKDLEKVKL